VEFERIIKGPFIKETNWKGVSNIAETGQEN
jgi:hypothetical protein